MENTPNTIYEFRQNNSGGSFREDKKKGIGLRVFIEAASAEEANKKAQDIGLYFDGCYEGIDCPCCGDRWYEADDYDVVTTPKNDEFDAYWGIDSYFHKSDGSVETINSKKV
jgi:hypothetical protein